MDQDEKIHRDDLADAIRATPKHTGLPTIEKVRKVVEQRQCARVNGVLLDLFTASAVLQVYEKLSSENQVKFAAMPIRKMVNITWTLVKKCG